MGLLLSSINDNQYVPFIFLTSGNDKENCNPQLVTYTQFILVFQLVLIYL